MRRLLDLYLSGEFEREVLTDRKSRIEAAIQAIERERETLAEMLERKTLIHDVALARRTGGRAGALVQREPGVDQIC